MKMLQHVFLASRLNRAITDSVGELRYGNHSKDYETWLREMCRKGRTLSLLKEMRMLSEGRKYMLRSASARICVTDTQACTRGAILTSIEIKVITERYTRIRMFCRYHKNIHDLFELLTVERRYLSRKNVIEFLSEKEMKFYINFRRNVR